MNAKLKQTPESAECPPTLDLMPIGTLKSQAAGFSAGPPVMVALNQSPGAAWDLL
jgi:hypothetical protein